MISDKASTVKQKAKEKEKALKAKEKEKALKQKAKEKEKALKAKEKEKALKQKAKEKEKALKAKEKEKALKGGTSTRTDTTKYEKLIKDLEDIRRRLNDLYEIYDQYIDHTYFDELEAINQQYNRILSVNGAFIDSSTIAQRKKISEMKDLIDYKFMFVEHAGEFLKKQVVFDTANEGKEGENP